jgi:hypothetical protein
MIWYQSWCHHVVQVRIGLRIFAFYLYFYQCQLPDTKGSF